MRVRISFREVEIVHLAVSLIARIDFVLGPIFLRVGTSAAAFGGEELAKLFLVLQVGLLLRRQICPAMIATELSSRKSVHEAAEAERVRHGVRDVLPVWMLVDAVVAPGAVRLARFRIRDEHEVRHQTAVHAAAVLAADEPALDCAARDGGALSEAVHGVVGAGVVCVVVVDEAAAFAADGLVATRGEDEVLAPFFDVLAPVGFFEEGEELVLGDGAETIFIFAGVFWFRQVGFGNIELHFFVYFKIVKYNENLKKESIKRFFFFFEHLIANKNKIFFFFFTFHFSQISVSKT